MSLYVISTPIGNLGDITQRAKETLSEMDIVLAEDTRKTNQLFNHFQISGPSLTAYNEQNKQEKIPLVIKWLKEGRKVGLVSNAGTPLISDPGYQLVRLAVKERIEIIAIPGPSALITALVVSGFPPTRFVFLGFLPKSRGKKTKIFKNLLKTKNQLPTVVFYESPNRVIKTLQTVLKTAGDVQVVICRELTKKFEEKIRGTLKEVLEKLGQNEKIKGEITVVLKLK